MTPIIKRLYENLPNFIHADEIIPFPKDYYMRRIQNNDPVTNPATPRYLQQALMGASGD